MAPEIQEYAEGARSRQILSHMVTSRTVVSQIATSWKPQGLFDSFWENVVGSWCVEFYRKHGKAPNKAIRPLFHEFAESSPDKESVRMIDGFLSHLSQEFEQQGKLTASYVIDLAGKHFSRIALTRLMEDIGGCVERGDFDKGVAHVQEFRRVEMGTGSFIEMQTDEANIRSSFAEAEETLIEYPGDLGRFFRHVLTRDALVAFQAIDKSGKSYWLLDMAVTAIEQRKRVGLFAIGDLSKLQMNQRYSSRVSRRPIFGDGDKRPIKTRLPQKILPPTGQGEIARVTYDVREYDGPLDEQSSWEGVEKHRVKKCGTNDNYLRMVCEPNDSINILQIRDRVMDWSQKGFHCDILIIDYSDILAPIPGHREERDQINATWKKMRALATEMKCLVVTATQSDAKAYESNIQSRKNFSGDKRKLAHASSVIGINATDEERAAGVCRLNHVVKRVGAFNSKRVVYVAGNLAIACPHLCSTF